MSERELATMILGAIARPAVDASGVLYSSPSPVMSPGKRSKRGNSSSVEDQFYAGNYLAIVREQVDGGSSTGPLSELPFIVGALAFIGRLEEARALFSSHLRRQKAARDEPEIVAARFFLGVAYCRAGRMSEALREFMSNVRARRGGSLARFYVFQGLGCYRYFMGRLRQSARQALYALEHAFIADFPYGRLLATDLRGHTLVQLGRVQSGLSLLETARTLARSLALEGNAAALDCAIGMYRARFGVVPVRQAIQDLQALLRQAGPEDSYSERMLRIELAIQAALAGEGDTAWGLLERLGTEHVPDGGDARARIRYLLACANVARLRYGAPSMAPFVSEARALLSDRLDIALEVEVLCMELLSTSDEGERARIRVELRSLRQGSGIERFWLRGAESSSNACFSVPPGAEALEEDRLGALYVACLEASPALASRLVASGHFGLIPLALGLEPGKRILLFGRRLIIEDQGNVTVISDPPEGQLRFLGALADGRHHSKEELLSQVWGVPHYRPDAHDPVIHTAVSRLRAQLGVRGHWVEAALGGYQLARGVEVSNPFEGTLLPVPSEPALDSGVISPGRTSRGVVPAVEHDPVLQLLAKSGPVSSSAVASHLGVSEMTALRRLREHVEHGSVTRDGKGKNTRYRLVC